MNQSKWRLALTAVLLTALLITALAPAAFAAEQSAPASQVRATEVSGTVPGGQFAKLWLGLEITNPGNFTVTATWDRLNPEQNGVGFYILDPGNVAAVSMGERIERNQLAMGDSNFFVVGEKNVQGASIRAVGTDYTIVVYNDSATDARFTLSVDNGIIVDNDNQVDAPAAATESTPASTEAASTEAASTEATTTVATTTVATTTVATTTEATTTEAATTATVAAPAAAAPATTTAPAAGPFRSSSVKGELNEQYEQHYLGLEPEQRDSEITLRLSFDPRDNQELARRLNFWVLDEQGLVRYQSGENASDLAVANGNRVTTPGDENVRTTSFFAPGLGTYTVIVYNNSRIPATYELSATSAVLIDGSQQTTSAQEAAGSATTVAATTATTATATAATTAAPTAATPAAGSGAAGEPGGTYTVVSGDTLAIIARDIYGDYKLYEKLCAFNKLTDCNVIEVGQVINLPTREQIGAVATTTTAAATTEEPAAATQATTQATTVAATAATTATTPATTITATTPATTTATTTATAAVTATATTTSTAAPRATETIVEIAQSNPNFSILAKALESTGLATTLGSGDYTVFAPTDAAFNELLTQTGLAADQLLKAPELQQILQYHVLSGEVGSTDITNGMRATTVQGKQVTFEIKDGSVYINGAKVTIADIPASNGIIHAISAVILPPAQ